jgi:hypothetical protein
MFSRYTLYIVSIHIYIYIYIYTHMYVTRYITCWGHVQCNVMITIQQKIHIGHTFCVSRTISAQLADGTSERVQYHFDDPLSYSRTLIPFGRCAINVYRRLPKRNDDNNSNNSRLFHVCRGLLRSAVVSEIRRRACPAFNATQVKNKTIRFSYFFFFFLRSVPTRPAEIARAPRTIYRLAKKKKKKTYFARKTICAPSLSGFFVRAIRPTPKRLNVLRVRNTNLPILANIGTKNCWNSLRPDDAPECMKRVALTIRAPPTFRSGRTAVLKSGVGRRARRRSSRREPIAWRGRENNSARPRPPTIFRCAGSRTPHWCTCRCEANAWTTS